MVSCGIQVRYAMMEGHGGEIAAYPVLIRKQRDKEGVRDENACSHVLTPIVSTSFQVVSTSKSRRLLGDFLDPNPVIIFFLFLAH